MEKRHKSLDLIRCEMTDLNLKGALSTIIL
jgi:hypothetical protein